MTDNKTKCRWCGATCNHDDDALDECRFCHDGSLKRVEESNCIDCCEN